jgi:hypothetical protein
LHLVLAVHTAEEWKKFADDKIYPSFFGLILLRVIIFIIKYKSKDIKVTGRGGV